MKIVIDVPEEDYEYLKAHNEHGLYSSILNGTPLPKGCGRLLSERKMLERLEEWHTNDAMDMAHYNFTFARIIESDTIIEADTTRDCKTCRYSNDGKCAGTEECHDCMWESKYIKADKDGAQE